MKKSMVKKDDDKINKNNLLDKEAEKRRRKHLTQLS